jgi:hypothetical protein
MLRDSFVGYLAERIEHLWLEPRSCPDVPLIKMDGQDWCVPLNNPSARYHLSLRHFQAEQLPKPSLSEYLLKIVHSCEATGESLVRSVFLLAYFRYRYRDRFPLTIYTIHRLLLAAVVCSVKFSDDIPWANAHIAHLANVTPSELNRLELEFIFLIDFQVYVPISQLEPFLKEIFATKSHELMRLPFDVAMQAVTVKNFRDTCTDIQPNCNPAPAIIRPNKPPIHEQPTTTATASTPGRPKLDDLLDYIP